MKKTIILCDYCKAEITSDTHSIKVGAQEPTIWAGDVRYFFPAELIFCSWDCFMRYIDNWHKVRQHIIENAEENEA